MRLRSAAVCAVACVLAAAVIPAQEREDRTLLSNEQMLAIVNEASGERAMHHRHAFTQPGQQFLRLIGNVECRRHFLDVVTNTVE